MTYALLIKIPLLPASRSLASTGLASVGRLTGDYFSLGARALELLATTAPDDPIAETVTEPVELIVRGSTAPPPD